MPAPTFTARVVLGLVCAAVVWSAGPVAPATALPLPAVERQTFAAAAAAPNSRDRSFGPDKLAHFGVSATLSGLGSTGLTVLRPRTHWAARLAFGTGVATFVGLAKEAFDARWGRGFSGYDLMADAAGALFGALIAWGLEAAAARLDRSAAAPAAGLDW